MILLMHREISWRLTLTRESAATDEQESIKVPLRIALDQSGELPACGHVDVQGLAIY
jgi:hypothetical protein